MKYDITQPPRRAQRTTSAYPAVRKATEPPGELPHARPQRGRWYLGCAVGMLIIVGILFTFSKLVIPFYQHTMNHWSYGDALVYHVRADLGRGSASDVYTMSESNNIIVVIVTNAQVETHTLKMSTGDTGSMLILVSLADVNADGRERYYVTQRKWP